MHYNHIIIGAGSMGMAAGYFLAKKGSNTLLLDAFNPPHDKASHHGETRLIRYAYGEGLEYVPLALRAGELWKELETQTDKEIFCQTGIINVGYKNKKFIKNVITSAKHFNLPLEVLTAEQVNQRWPGVKLTDDLLCCFEPTSGVLRVENCISAYRILAEKEGASIRTNSRVVHIEPDDKKIVVITADGAIFTADDIIISVGAWSKQLLNELGLSLPLTPIRKTFAWYNADEELYSKENFPGFAFNLDETEYYGFPSIDGAGLKVGRHDGGEEIDPNEERLPFGSIPEDERVLNQFLSTYMPQVKQLKLGKTCMYSMTPYEDFIIDFHPKFKNITIAAGFSGHGFKFSSVVGEILSELATNRTTNFNISPFSINRFNG